MVPKPSINQFLISLAAEEGEAAVGIVLSGTGSDGTAGLRAIQAGGGYTFAQSPASAKYDGMPRAAIEAGVADHVLTPEEIAIRLPGLLEQPHSESELTPSADLLDKLLARIRENLHFDFSGYKVSTLMRRVRRRQVTTGKPDLADYLAALGRNPLELTCAPLAQALNLAGLIGQLYVFEGAQLGARVIAARIGKILPAVPQHFFTAPEAEQRWHHFCESANTLCTPKQHEEARLAALRVFRFYSNHLDLCRGWLHGPDNGLLPD